VLSQQLRRRAVCYSPGRTTGPSGRFRPSGGATGDQIPGDAAAAAGRPADRAEQPDPARAGPYYVQLDTVDHSVDRR
jgi:hypothetical protein